MESRRYTALREARAKRQWLHRNTHIHVEIALQLWKMQKAGVSMNICMCFLFTADADVCSWQFSTIAAVT